MILEDAKAQIVKSKGIVIEDKFRKLEQTIQGLVERVKKIGFYSECNGKPKKVLFLKFL